MTELGDYLDVGFFHHVGITLETAEADRVVLNLDVGPQHHQPYGIVHGGVYCSLVETAASVGAAVWLGPDRKVVGVTNTTHFLRAVREGRLTATATPIHRGRSQQLWLVEIAGDDGKIAARGEVRLQNLDR